MSPKASSKLTTEEKYLKRILEELRNPSMKKVVLQNFLKGIAYALGMIVAAAIVLPLLLYMLRQVDWVPMLGDLASDIAERMDRAQ